MFISTLEPLLLEAKQAISLAQEGKLDECRVKLDRIRYLRSLTARTREQMPTQEDIVAEEASLSRQLVETYRTLAENVNECITHIESWIASSRQSFSVLAHLQKPPHAAQ